MPLPKDENIERAVVGAILFDCDRAMSMLSGVRLGPDHFSDRRCRNVYCSAVERWNAGKNVDVLTVGQDLAGTVEHDYMLAAMDVMPTLAHVGEYAERLHDFYIRRQMIMAAQEMAERAVDMDADAEESRSVTELRLSQMTAKTAHARTVGAILDAQIERWEIARDRGCVGLATGFECVDLYLGGLMDSAFIIVSGPPASCKTTLIRNCLENIAMRGIRVSMLSLEQTSEQILGACAARVAKQSVFDLNRGWRKSDIDAVKAAKSTVELWPLIVEDRPHTLSEACSWIRREVGKGSRAVVVDYLQRIMPDSHMQKNSDESKVREISTTLANMAKETGVPVVAVSSLSRAGNLRGSGQIEYDAYSMLRIDKAEHPSDPSKQWRVDNLVYSINVEKQRFGPPAETQYLFLLGNEGRMIGEENESVEYKGYHQEDFG